ncbi:MAG: hypothetical protein OHK0022_29640 [Roseiflexaceae bacterium]
MVTAEQVYRYPRVLRWSFELLAAVAVVPAVVFLARDLLRFLWYRFGLDTSLFRPVPYLPEIVRSINGPLNATPTVIRPSDLLPVLIWLLLALLLALLLRNSFPTVRTSARGMLVEFAGDWLPVSWEHLRTIKVTEDLSGERYVLLAETDSSQLTGWHRIYSLLYNVSFQHGFLISSWISNFDDLIKTLLSESDRVARVVDKQKAAKLQESSSSPLFRFLLSPASFFSQRAKTEPVAGVGGGPLQSGVLGTYPARIITLLTWGTAALMLLLLVRYLTYWLQFLALVVPSLRSLPVFSSLTLLPEQTIAPLWMLVAAHLLVVVMLVLLVWLRNLLPELEARPEGLAVRYFNRWLTVPWERITSIKVTEFSEQSQILLIQTRGVLPTASRLSSLFYDGTLTPGVLVTSALSTFEPLVQRIVQEVSRRHPANEEEESPIFHSDAYSPLLLMSLRAAPTIDDLVAESRNDPLSGEVQTPRLLRAARPMLALALMPALLVFAERAIRQGVAPSVGLLGGMLILVILGMLEWPLISVGTSTLDEMSGGEEGNRALYLYPITQLPRILPLLLGLLLTLLGMPVVALLLWLVSIGWSFLLASGLWGELYDWSGTQLVGGAMIPVVFQLLILLAYLVAV